MDTLVLESKNATEIKKYNVKAELCKNLSKVDLQELCDATEEAILAGGGLGGFHLHH